MPNQPNRTNCVAVSYWLPIELREGLRIIARERDVTMTNYVIGKLWPAVQADLAEIKARQ